MPKNADQTVIIVSDNPKTGAAVIKAELPEGDAAKEAEKLKQDGMKAVKVVRTPDPHGNAG